MTERSYYNWKIHIIRPGADYGLKKDIKLTARLFVPEHEERCISIGGADNDDIKINKLANRHATCIFCDPNLILRSTETFQIALKDLQKKVPMGQKLRLNLKTQGYSYKITFPNSEAHIIGKIDRPKEAIKPEGLTYLEAKHGPLRQIEEGKSCLLFKTLDNRVLKVLCNSYTGSKNVIKRFLKSAEKLSKLRDPGFIKINGIYKHSRHNLHYVIMDYVRGESLKNYLARRGVLSEEEARSIIREIAQRLIAMQKVGYCCRNLTPDNILMGEDGCIRITGFFLLKSEAQLTAAGAQMFVPKYSAPELIKDSSTVDILSDIFSLGAILYEMLIGEPPIRCSTPAQYIAYLSEARNIKVREIMEIAPDVSLDTCKLITALLTFEKTKRPGPQQVIQMLSQGVDARPWGEKNRMFSKIGGLQGEVTRTLPHDEKNPSVIIDSALDEEGFDSDLFTEENLKLLDGETDTNINININITKSKPVKARLYDDDEFGDSFEEVKDKGKGLKREEKYTIKYCLEIVTAPRSVELKKFVFSSGRPIIIGREGDFCIANDIMVSRRHASIEIVDNNCYLADMGSHNGTYMNDQEITRLKIKSGAHFTIGETTIRFYIIKEKIGAPPPLAFTDEVPETIPRPAPSAKSPAFLKTQETNSYKRKKKAGEK